MKVEVKIALGGQPIDAFRAGQVLILIESTQPGGPKPGEVVVRGGGDCAFVVPRTMDWFNIKAVSISGCLFRPLNPSEQVVITGE